jgi:hypothetical protein
LSTCFLMSKASCLGGTCSAYRIGLGKRRPGQRWARAWPREGGQHWSACAQHLLHPTPPQEPLAAPPPAA